MSDWLFTAEEERLSPAVVFATAGLIAVFALGLVYRGLAIVLF
ncbi:hypothetical protein [Natrialba asiatica]|uniref:Uncharacterized protein n=1 Tax=Natrialba asiatica (strain ATCC 700177 / DSM 12278 / JCM 9576 / FERM P-10747 / NBRC 102637 / 172P1) TaxID=29540 RepID=M0AY48_NATA1|nr:hypothetical protein [Natrialba asiatica]ELZ02344.1 hypothetical protein C481_06726 [Natrialba asiatica DSM 12278]